MENNNTKEFTIMDLYVLIRRNLWLILLFSFIGILSGYVYSSFIISPKYESKISFMLVIDNDSGTIGEDNTGLTYAKSVVYNCIDMMVKNVYLKKVSDNLKDKDINISAQELSSLISYSSATNSSSINAVISTKDAEKSLLIAQALNEVTADHLGDIYEKIKVVTQQTPSLATKPSSPNIPLYTIAGLILGAAAITVVLLVLTFASIRVNDEEKLIAEFSLPIMGIVTNFPQDKEQLEQSKKFLIKPKVSKRAYNLISDDSPFEINEAFRNIKTNICFSIPKKSDSTARIISVTSSEKAEGKTTISSNTALAFAKSKMKTLLIDADLRKPKINKFFRTENHLGLSDYLSGEAQIDEVINTTKYENLFTIIAGTLPPNPIELLSSDGMAGLIGKIKNDFEVIIIDTPPVEWVSDSLVLSSIVDGTLVVVKHRLTTYHELHSILRKIEFSKMKTLGFVLNGYTEQGRDKYGYSYKYGYINNEEMENDD